MNDQGVNDQGPMRWMIGVDLAGTSSAAVALGDWMATRNPADTFFGVHVVETIDIDPPLTRNVTDHVERALEPLRASSYFEEIGTLSATAAEDGLEAAVRQKSCDAIIIGRRSADPTALVRLGRVARRMLRTLACPVVVVPPGLDVAALAGGPVVLATDLGPASEGAAAFAPRLARGLDLDLLVTHVASVPATLEAIVPSEQWRALVDRSHASARERFGPWLKDHGLSQARHSIVEGSPASAILDVVKVSGASMLVLGSRGLDTIDRIFMSSLASELAAAADVPVAVVPHR